MLKEFKKKETNRYELDITVDAEKFADAVKRHMPRTAKKSMFPVSDAVRLR